MLYTFSYQKKGYRLIGLAVIIIPLLGLIYLIYTAVYPDDSFYFSEFKEVTLRDAPASATILRKDVSYPDFHGDYCSALLMRMPAGDYSRLLKDLANDKRITKNEQDNIILSSELSEVMGDFRTEQIIHGFIRKIAGQEDHFCL